MFSSLAAASKSAVGVGTERSLISTTLTWLYFGSLFGAVTWKSLFAPGTITVTVGLLPINVRGRPVPVWTKRTSLMPSASFAVKNSCSPSLLTTKSCGLELLAPATRLNRVIVPAESTE